MGCSCVALNPAMRPFVSGLMQNGTVTVDVTGNENRQIADLHGVWVVDRYAARVEWRTEFFQTQPIEIRHATEAGKYLVDEHTVRAAGHAQLAIFFTQFRGMAEPELEILADDVDGRLIHDRVLQTADTVEFVDAGDVDSHALQGLAEFQSDYTQSDHGQCVRQIFKFEDTVGGDDAITKFRPCRRHERPRAGGDDDFTARMI